MKGGGGGGSGERFASHDDICDCRGSKLVRFVRSKSAYMHGSLNRCWGGGGGGLP